MSHMVEFFFFREIFFNFSNFCFVKGAHTTSYRIIMWIILFLILLGIVFGYKFRKNRYILEMIKSVPVQIAYGKTRSFYSPYVTSFTDHFDVHHICDHVYLGDIPSAGNLKRLKELGITHILTAILGNLQRRLFCLLK